MIQGKPLQTSFFSATRVAMTLVWFTTMTLVVLPPPSSNLADAYSRRLRSPWHQERYLIQSLTSIDRKNFQSLECKGRYHQGIFSKLDLICDDCYQLYKEPEVHSMCRADCFTSPVFRQCIDALMLQEHEELYSEMIRSLRE
ncbi:CHH-like protein isoform X2 [Tigriopus californicus]|nr:CHH-like protein isoform X2 [Tigriopus californicus]